MIDSEQFILTTESWLRISDYLNLALQESQPLLLMMDPTCSSTTFAHPDNVRVRIEDSNWVRLVAREVSIRTTYDQLIISGEIGEAWMGRKAGLVTQAHFFCGIVPSMKMPDFQMRERITDPLEPVKGVSFECPGKWVHVRGTALSSGVWIPCV